MARTFSGSGQGLAYTGAVLTAPPLSFACWFNTNSSSKPLLNITQDAGSSNGFLLYITAARSVAIYSSSAAAISSVGTAINEWHHACGVIAASNSRAAYVNGGNKGTNTSNATVSGVDITKIAQDAAGGGLADYAGLLAEAAIWNVALPDEAIRLLYASRMRPCDLREYRENLVAYWPLYGMGAVERDEAGRYDMAVTGATAAPHPYISVSRRLWVPMAAVAAPATGNPYYAYAMQ